MLRKNFLNQTADKKVADREKLNAHILTNSGISQAFGNRELPANYDGGFRDTASRSVA